MTIELFRNDGFDLQITPVGESFTVAAPGLARGLGFRDANTMLHSVPDKHKGYGLVRTPGGHQEAWHVTEPGFYRLVGQRHLGRIKNEAERANVERFQDWVFDEVIPQIRRTGAYQLPDENDYEPETLTMREVASVLRQRYGFEGSTVNLMRQLRTAGVLRQDGAPRAGFDDLFWFTGSAYTVQPWAIRRLATRMHKLNRPLQERREFQGICQQLVLDGMGADR